MGKAKRAGPAHGSNDRGGEKLILNSMGGIKTGKGKLELHGYYDILTVNTSGAHQVEVYGEFPDDGGEPLAVVIVISPGSRLLTTLERR
jgi:hypothetical protein